MEPTLEQIFGSYMAWKMDEQTWFINFMNGSQNMYLLEGDDKALLIDTGYGVGNLRAFVEKLTDKPILVANTHYHPDHSAGNGEFEQVYMSKGATLDKASVDAPGAVPFDLSKLPYPNYEKIYVGEGDKIELGGRTIEILDVKPAHCNSSLFFLDRGHRMFFCGDDLESAQVNLFDNSQNPDIVYDLKVILKNFQDNCKKIEELKDQFDYLLPNHNGFPIAKGYITGYIELVDAIYNGTAIIEDKLNHPFIEMDPQASKLCRVRWKNGSIFTYKEQLMELYGKCQKGACDSMKTNEINIRDPYVLLHNGCYYLYGTRSATCWGPADGFDCYTSEDMENWHGPIEIFHRPKGFFADQAYWAPECIYYKDAFYLITTFGAQNMKKGIYILKSDNPTGPFEIYSERLTPEDWACIDGTIYFDDNIPYLIFSHSFEDTPDGDMCVMQLSGDLTKSVSESITLFSAGEADWVKPIPFAKAEFGMDGDVYFTDGPCVTKMEDEKLYMTWSSWSVCGYAVGVAVSDTGSIDGPWRQLDTPLFPENGGHGMMFRDNNGKLMFTLHFPNDKYKERPMFAELVLQDGTLQLKK